MEHERSTYAVVYEQFCTNGLLLHLHILSFEKIANVFFLAVTKTRCSTIADRPRCRVRYSFRQK